MLSFKKTIDFVYNVTKKAVLQWRTDQGGDANAPQWGTGTNEGGPSPCRSLHHLLPLFLPPPPPR